MSGWLGVRLAAMRWKTYDEMSRLEQKMFWAVRESTMLHELPMPEVDNPGSDNEVRWPAEMPEDCAEVLLRWFDEGLVGVVTTRDAHDLPRTEARHVLADYTAWSSTYSLTITDAGEAALV